MFDFLNSETNLFNSMALLLGVSFFGVLFLSLGFGKLLLLLKVPRRVVQSIISLIGAFSFIYVVVFLGERFL